MKYNKIIDSATYKAHNKLIGTVVFFIYEGIIYESTIIDIDEDLIFFSNKEISINHSDEFFFTLKELLDHLTSNRIIK